MQDFDAFRAQYPDASAAIEKCERPDWMLRIAREQAGERKRVVAAGVYVIDSLGEGWLALLAALLPWPTSIEAAEAWADPHPTTRRQLTHLVNDHAYAVLRHILYVVVLTTPAIFALHLYVMKPKLGNTVAGYITLALVHVLPFVVWRPLTRFMTWQLERAAKRLDDDRAFAIVVRELERRTKLHLRRGSRPDREKVNKAATHLRDKLARS